MSAHPATNSLPMIADDEPLLPRIAAGDGAAVQACMDRYGGLVWSLARRRCPTTADAEDAVQEIFVAVWETADRYDPDRASEKTFIAMIARRRLIDRWRKRSRRPEPLPLPDLGPDPGSDDHRAMEYGAEAALVRRFLHDLPEDRRRVIELSVFWGLTHREIADHTQLALGTVKSHLRRGLLAVRDALLEADRNAPAAGGLP